MVDVEIREFKMKVRVRFRLDDESLSGETLWAEHMDGHSYKLLNIPFIAFGYSEGDIVHCVIRDGLLEVISLVKSSGNGTIRIIFKEASSNDIQHVLRELVSVGCTYERASSSLVAVTVPSTLQIPFSQLANYLNSLSDDVLVGWEIAKPLTRLTA